MPALNLPTPSVMTPDQSRAVCDAGLYSLASIRWLTMQLIEKLTPEQWMHQFGPAANHVMFNVGHIAICDVDFIRASGGDTTAVPASYEALFAPGAKPSPDAADYPAPQEVMRVLQQVRAELLTHFQSLPNEQLMAPPQDERLIDITPTIAHIPGFTTLHESTHTGQLLSIRQSLRTPHIGLAALPPESADVV